MQSRHRIWILSIIGWFIITFLVGFQPVRKPPQEFVPEAKFEFMFTQPLATNSGQWNAKALELNNSLVAAGFDKDNIETVKLLANDHAQITTYAVKAEQVTEDEQALLKAIQTKYKDVKMLPRVEDTASQEKPLFQLGKVLAIYKPRPHVKLGLDLQGGLHVVLRCLPSATMYFSTPEDKQQDFYTESAAIPAAATAAAGATPATTISRTEIENKLLKTLVSTGLAKDTEVKIDAVSPKRITVRTQAKDMRTAKAQQRELLRTLQETYPGYAIKDEEPAVIEVTPDTADKVKGVIDRRLFSLGEIREPIIQKQGNDKIIVEIPGVKDPDRVASILKSTAMLEFRLIPRKYESSGEEDNYDEWRDKGTGQMVGWDRVIAEAEPAEFRGSDLLPNSQVVSGTTPGQWEVSFELQASKKKDFLAFTRNNVGRLMAIVLDEKCQMAPVIKSPIPGSGVISGNFTAEDAGDLRLLLNAGALPVPLEVAENRTVSATLGQDTIDRSIMSGLIGLLVVAIFMVAYYRLPGLLACLALLLYVLVVLAVVALSQMIKGMGGITLTLPGIAGVIISIGMAVDANVLIFERLKEELRAGKSMRAAVHAGFDRAWTAIVDSNVTTLITCAVLYFLGTSFIKSFAAMLFIGVACSFFTAVTVSRWLVTMVAETHLGQNPALWGVSEQDR